MPLYDYECSRCGRFEASRPMAESSQPHACPDCGRQAQRILPPAAPAGHTFTAYTSCAGGAPEHLMRRAVREGENYYLPLPGGGRRQLNNPGEKLHPVTGDVIIETAAQRRAFQRANNLVDLTGVDIKAENNRRTEGNRRRAERLQRRLKLGAEAARRRGRKVGWLTPAEATR